MSATLVLDEKYNNQKPGLCSDSGFPQIADNSDTSCLGIGGRRLSAFDLIYCGTILGQFRICILYILLFKFCILYFVLWYIMIQSWAAWVFGVLFFVPLSLAKVVFLIRILKYWPSFVHISVFCILYFLHVGGERRVGFTNISSYAWKLLSTVNDTTYVDWLTHPAVRISTDINNNPWLMMVMNIESKRNPNQNLALHTIRQCDHKLHLLVEAPRCPSSPANFQSNGKIKSMPKWAKFRCYTNRT